MAEAKFFSGIDVSKKWLDIAIQPTDRTWRVQNDMEGIRTLTQQL
jgi:transposase